MTEASFDPAADGWSVAPSDAFIDAIGPSWRRRGALGIVARDMHDNGAGVMHGGALMAFIDYALGETVAAGGPRLGVTIELNVQFVAPIPIGAFVVAAPQITRRTKSLVFVRGEFLIDEAVVATASGIWRVFSEKR